MTHGRKAETRVNRRSKKSSSLLTGFSRGQEKSLEARVTQLEARVAAMQEEIDRASGVVPPYIQEAIDSIGKNHAGARKKIDDTELVLNRDNLIIWLEERWPKIAKPLLTARTPDEIVAILTKVAAAADIRPTWQKAVTDHPDELLQFLRSAKFRRKPPKKTIVNALALHRSEKRDRAANRLPTRQIANATAGVPKLSWRTSLDKCSKRPSSYGVGHNTAQHYRAMFRIHESN
jgi:hypothetical protein